MIITVVPGMRHRRQTRPFLRSLPIPLFVLLVGVFLPHANHLPFLPVTAATSAQCPYGWISALRQVTLDNNTALSYPPGNTTIDSNSATLYPPFIALKTPMNQSTGAYWILKPGEGHMAGGFRITFEWVFETRLLWGFALILYNGPSIANEYDPSIYNHNMLKTADGSQLGYFDLPLSLAIEVDLVNDGDWDGPAPHISIHSSSDMKWNNAGSGTRIGTQQSWDIDTSYSGNTKNMVVEYDPTSKQLIAKLGNAVAVANIDSAHPPYFGSSDHPFTGVGFSTSRSSDTSSNVYISNFQLSTVPNAPDQSELILVGGTNGTYLTNTGYGDPQAIFTFKDACGTPMSPPTLSMWKIVIKDSTTGQPILTGTVGGLPGTNGGITADLVGSQLQIKFYLKPSSLAADVPLATTLYLTLNNVLWPVTPNITFVRAVPVGSVSIVTGPSLIQIGIPQMWTLKLRNADGVPAIYDNSTMSISYGLEVGGWIEQNATVNIADRSIVYLPLTLQFYPDQLQTNLYIKFGSMKVKWFQVNVTLKYVPTPSSCTIDQVINLNLARDFIYGSHSSSSDAFDINLFTSGSAWNSKPLNDVWLGSAFVNRPIYLGGGFSWFFSVYYCTSMAVVLFAGDHPPNASDFSPLSYGQDLTARLDGFGWHGLHDALAIEMEQRGTWCDINAWRSNSSDSIHPIRVLSNATVPTQWKINFELTYSPSYDPKQLSLSYYYPPDPTDPNSIYEFRHATIDIPQTFIQSQSFFIGYTASSKETPGKTFSSPSLKIVPINLAQSYITFPQDNTLTYVAQAGFSSQPQAVLQLVNQCGRITYLDGISVNISIVDSTSSTPTKIETKIVPLKGQYQLFWYTLGADQPFQANLLVKTNGTIIKNAPIILTFIPSVPAKEQSTLPPNIATMIAGVSYVFELILRDQFNNLAVYDPNQSMVAYGVLGHTLTNVTQVNAVSRSKVQFSFSVSQVPANNPITFIIKYGSEVWSSYQIMIVSAEVELTQTRFSSLASSQWVESSQSLTISTFDKYKNPVPATLASINFVFLFISSQHPSGLSAFTNGVRPSGTLVYNGNSNIATLTLSSNVAGNHSLQVYVKDQLQLTLSLLVQSNLAPVSSAVVSSIKSIDSSRTDLQLSFTLDLFDAYLNPVSPRVSDSLFDITLEHTSPQYVNVTTSTPCHLSSSSAPQASSTGIQALCIWDDVKLGYSVFVNSSVAGQYRVASISPDSIRNVSISFLAVIPGPISASKSSVQLAVSTFVAGTFPLTITLRDAVGQDRFDLDDSAAIELRLISSRNGDILNGVMKLTSNGSATYRVTNTPTQAGSYLLSIVTAHQSMSLTSDQVKITVIPAEINSSRTSYSLTALPSAPSATATQPFNFTLITRDSYDNQLTHGGAEIALVGLTRAKDSSNSSSSSSSSGGNSNATSSSSTGSRRLLASLTDNTYSVTDHDNGTYTITVTFSNDVANSVYILQPLVNEASAVPTPAITIQPADPCLSSLRVCGVSSKCVSLYNSFNSSFSRNCNPIMTITSVTPLVTGTNGGGAPITITLLDAPDVNQTVTLSVRGPSHSFLANATQQPNQFTFSLPPALSLGYTQNEIPKGDSQGQLMTFNVESKIDGIYYNVTSDTKLRLVNSSCFTPDYYWRVTTDECIPCPLNGYCPGGNQMYPLAGYYSNSLQDESPKSCTPTSACKGFSAESFDPVTGQLRYNLDSQCDDGYQGKLCSQCDSAYYKDQQVCRSCGLDDTAKRQLILVLILALVVFTVMALGVAFVDDTKLSLYIAVIVLIQHCSFVGSVGASHISASGLSEFFQFISLLNFEIAYFKLGCSVPQITYVKVFWATVLMIAVAAVMLTLASGLFALTRSVSYLVEKEATRMKVWTRRMQNSLTILGVVVYLQMTTQFFKGLFCVDLDGQSVLQVEASTVCYEGGHLATVIFIWPLLFIYSIGFPILCCWLAIRTRSLNQWASSAAKYIYIYRGLKIRFIYFKCFNFITSFALALQITLSTTSNVTVRMATAFLFFSLDVVSIGVYWPYFKRTENMIAIGGGLANALSGLAILTILSAQSGLEEQKLGELSGGPLFAVGLAVLAGFVLFIFPIRYLAHRYFPSPESPEDDQLLLEGRYNELAASRSKKGLGTLHFETKKHAKKLATVGKSTTGKLLPHLDDAASFGKAGGATEIEMMHNPMVKLDIADVSLSIPTKSDVPLSSPTHETATGDVTTIDPTANSDMMPHALASPSASSSSPPPLPFSTNVNGHEHQISKLPNPDSSSEGLASPSRFASPIEEDQQEESTHGGTDERKE